LVSFWSAVVLNKVVRKSSLRSRAIVEVAPEVLSQAITEAPALTLELLMRALSSNSDESWKDLEELGIHRLKPPARC
jgi:hypothetical protein